MPDHNTPSPESSVGTANIKVVGVGGGGQNAVNRMYRERVAGVEYISVNTDSQALDAASVPIRLRVGDSTARGLGVGGDPAKGRQCHEEDRDEIK
ncbi:MAG: cell division protein FtsZ, partial [Dehalococcoidia bacterium]